MISYRTQAILLKWIEVGSKCYILPFHWDHEKQTLIESTGTPKKVWRVCIYTGIVFTFLAEAAIAIQIFMDDRIPTAGKLAIFALITSVAVFSISLYVIFSVHHSYEAVSIDQHLKFNAVQQKLWNINPRVNDGITFFYFTIIGLSTVAVVGLIFLLACFTIIYLSIPNILLFGILCAAFIGNLFIIVIMLGRIYMHITVITKWLRKIR
jgi:hypothetical protein